MVLCNQVHLVCFNQPVPGQLLLYQSHTVFGFIGAGHPKPG